VNYFPSQWFHVSARLYIRVSTTATDSANSVVSTKDGAGDRRCTQHVKIPCKPMYSCPDFLGGIPLMHSVNGMLQRHSHKSVLLCQAIPAWFTEPMICCFCPHLRSMFYGAASCEQTESVPWILGDLYLLEWEPLAMSSINTHFRMLAKHHGFHLSDKVITIHPPGLLLSV
jgi:hypothetical protein